MMTRSIRGANDDVDLRNLTNDDNMIGLFGFLLNRFDSVDCTTIGFGQFDFYLSGRSPKKQMDEIPVYNNICVIDFLGETYFSFLSSL